MNETTFIDVSQISDFQFTIWIAIENVELSFLFLKSRINHVQCFQWQKTDRFVKRYVEEGQLNVLNQHA